MNNNITSHSIIRVRWCGCVQTIHLVARATTAITYWVVQQITEPTYVCVLASR